jgi:hypothetical protein
MSIASMIQQPSEEDISTFMGITGCSDNVITVRFLEGAGSLQTAINYYFDNPNRYDTVQTVIWPVARHRSLI